VVPGCSAYKKDVNLEKREYRVIIKKGNSYREVIKVILPNVIKYWEEIINESSEEDYLFTGT
jgi:hypothetical protein